MMPPFDVAETDRLLTTTRAVRRRLDVQRALWPEVVLECLRVASQAPNGGNSQGWRWVLVSDAGKRARLAKLYRAGGAAYFAQQRDPVSEAGERMRASADHLMEVIDQVPLLVVPCLAGRPTHDLAQAAGFFASIFPAVWSFQLALRSRGLGSVFTTFHLVHEPEAADLLGIPDNVTQAGMLPVAYTIGTDFRPAPRRPVEQIVGWNGWPA